MLKVCCTAAYRDEKKAWAGDQETSNQFDAELISVQLGLQHLIAACCEFSDLTCLYTRLFWKPTKPCMSCTGTQVASVPSRSRCPLLLLCGTHGAMMVGCNTIAKHSTTQHSSLTLYSTAQHANTRQYQSCFKDSASCQSSGSVAVTRKCRQRHEDATFLQASALLGLFLKRQCSSQDQFAVPCLRSCGESRQQACMPVHTLCLQSWP
jgi:hypothetical protein